MLTKTQFIAAIQSLRRPYVFEPSIKIREAHVTTERLLVTIDRADLETDEWKSLKAMIDVVEQLGFPTSCQQWLRRYHAGANAIHLGYEFEDGAVVQKLYLEYASALRTMPSLEPIHETLLYRALKWKVAGDDILHCSYKARPHDPRPVDERLCDFESDVPPLMMEIAIELARQALSKVDRAAMLLLEVSDPTGRISFDLNMYDAALSLGDVAWALAALSDSFQLSQRCSDLLLATPHKALGHFAFGRTGQGAPFATVYYGARRFVAA